MTIEPGERRRRRELERARELAAEEASAAGGAATGGSGARRPPAGLARRCAGGCRDPDDRPLSRRELRERERRRAAAAGEQTPLDRDPDARPDDDLAPSGRRTADGVPGSGRPRLRRPAAAAHDGCHDGCPTPSTTRPAAPAPPDAAWPAVTASPPAPATGTGAEDAATGPHDDDPAGDDLQLAERHRYTPTHYLALAAVAFVLGFLIWSLTTSTSESGALGAGAADPTTSLPVPPAALRGEP